MADVSRIERALVANRGEIAVRVARGARAAGIVPLGIYSAADRGAMHVRAMDDALEIGPAPAAESYLAIDRVIAAALTLRADAVHPGYGFLSERADFARAVETAGLIFVGPSPDALALMGDKTEAKRRARACGVPVVPGYDGDDLSPERLRAEAARIGTPFLVKASAGGGGRGMRVVEDLTRFDDALAAAKREALAAFGDDRVLLERYVISPRHIEFQILADRSGATVHLGERECSIQRRHQKIVEEAPSLALDAALRERMGEAAIAIARSVGYTNAGTVEFLLDAAGAFYFLEMNARLQVEHPVTELVHGIDLVGRQFAIAAGEALDLDVHRGATRGWAIEARLNAEDPADGYLPASGTIARFDVPTDPQFRFDLGYAAGDEVAIYYDSLLGKIVATGDDRAAALANLVRALDATRVDGVTTNLPLLRAIARDPAFAAGEATTTFLTDRAAALALALAPPSDDVALLAIAGILTASTAWRIAGVGIPIRLTCAGRAFAVTASRTGRASAWMLRGDLAGLIAVTRHGYRFTIEYDERRIVGAATFSTSEIEVRHAGRTHLFSVARPPSLDVAARANARGAGAVVAPMPGKIVKVAVATGDLVAERALLFVLEAMKMEHRIEATHAGTIASVAVAEGAVVARGATLLELA